MTPTLGTLALAAAAFAIYNAIATTQYARQATQYARQAQAACRDTWGIRNETLRRALHR